MLTKEPFKFAIGSPTNQERTYLCGNGVFIGNDRLVVAHALPIYRQKDYPNYQVRAKGPYVLSCVASGIRISATQQKMVFAKLEDAVKCGELLIGLLAMHGLPLASDDPRTILEWAKEARDGIWEPLKLLAMEHGASFVEPQK